VTVRPATEADLAALLALDHACTGTPHWSEPLWRDTLTSGRIVLLAEQAQQLAGFVVAHLIAGVATLESIAVLPDLRNTGIGRRLAEAALQYARTQGAEAMELEVRASNTAALQLYRGLGFLEQGRRGNYYAAPAEDAVLMGLSLVNRQAATAKV